MNGRIISSNLNFITLRIRTLIQSGVEEEHKLTHAIITHFDLSKPEVPAPSWLVDICRAELKKYHENTNQNVKV